MNNILLTLLILAMPPTLSFPASIKWLPAVPAQSHVTVLEAPQQALPLQWSDVLLEGSEPNLQATFNSQTQGNVELQGNNGDASLLQ
jgi:hypothetical protein